MASKLLSMSLDDIAKQQKRETHQSSGGGGGGGGRGRGGPLGGRNSPYARPGRTSDNADDKWQHDRFDDGSRRRGPPGRAGASAAAAAAPGMTSKLIIENLHYEVSEADLKSLLEEVGTIVKGPKIKFDKSGRSTGSAWVLYENPRDATAAKKAYNGALAKGQELKLSYDSTGIPRVASAGGSKDLLARMNSHPSRPNSRSRGREGSGNLRTASGRGARGAGGRGGPREKKEPKTAEQLDAELDAFMKPATTPSAGPPAATAQPAPTGDGDVEMA